MLGVEKEATHNSELHARGHLSAGAANRSTCVERNKSSTFTFSTILKFYYRLVCSLDPFL